MIDPRKICKKCGKPKKTVKKPLCDDCYMNKNFMIWKGHTENNIIFLTKKCIIFVERIEVEQSGNLFINDIGVLIEYHDEIFRRYNNYERLDTKQQYILMFRDVKKFIDNFKKDI